MPTLRLRIEGQPGVLGVRTFLTAVDESLHMLTDLDAGLSGSPGGTLDWNVERLTTGSAVIEIEARSREKGKNFGREVARYFVQGLEQLESFAATPPYLSEAGMRHARRLVKLIGRNGMSGLQASDFAETATVTAKAAANIEPLLRAGHHATGSVEGVIETVSIHRTPRFIVYLSRTRKAVTCLMPSESVREAAQTVMGRRVLVSGIVHYNARSEPMRVNAEYLRVLRREDELPSIEELAGSDPDFTGGLSTAEYIRELRSA